MVKVLQTSDEGYRKDIHKINRKTLNRRCKTPKVAIEDYFVSKAMKSIADIDTIKTCTVPKEIAGGFEEHQDEVNNEQIANGNKATVEENVDNVGENYINAVDDGGSSFSAADYHKSLIQMRRPRLPQKKRRPIHSACVVPHKSKPPVDTKDDDGYESFESLREDRERFQGVLAPLLSLDCAAPKSTESGYYFVVDQDTAKIVIKKLFKNQKRQ